MVLKFILIISLKTERRFGSDFIRIENTAVEVDLCILKRINGLKCREREREREKEVYSVFKGDNFSVYMSMCVRVTH